MTTYIDFAPSAYTPFQFQATLDGQVYNVVVPWNNWSPRYYLQINNLTGSNALTIPMVGSPLGFDISLTAGFFNSTLIFRSPNNQFEISP
jgi:hypothetical protein